MKTSSIIIAAIAVVTTLIFPPVGILLTIAMLCLRHVWANRDRLVKEVERDRELKNPADKSICPRCGSRLVEAVSKREGRFSLGRSAAGVLLVGGVGSLAGFTGSNNRIVFVCKKCGHQWK